MDYPFKSVAEKQGAFENRTTGLPSFLDLHYLFVSVIKTRDDFYEITYEFILTCKANNVVYVEYATRTCSTMKMRGNSWKIEAPENLS